MTLYKREADSNNSVNKAIKALHALALEVELAEELLDQIATTGRGSISQETWTTMADITAEVITQLKDSEKHIRLQRATNLLREIRGY